MKKTILFLLLCLVSSGVWAATLAIHGNDYVSSTPGSVDTIAGGTYPNNFGGITPDPNPPIGSPDGILYAIPLKAGTTLNYVTTQILDNDPNCSLEVSVVRKSIGDTDYFAPYTVLKAPTAPSVDSTHSQYISTASGAHTVSASWAYYILVSKTGPTNTSSLESCSVGSSRVVGTF